MSTLFLEPLDALILRGNKLFGDPGSYGEALIPPSPSVAAGAIRSRMLADAGIDLAVFARGKIEHPELGTPSDPKNFVLQHFQLARKTNDDDCEILLAPPADLSIAEDEHGKPHARRALPTMLTNAIASSSPLPMQPILAESVRSKPAGGYWLTQSGFARYLQGGTPQSDELIPSSELWRMDERIGVGLSSDTRSVENGKLFSTQAIIFQPGIGFIATVNGATAPTSGLLRFGGDGRAVAIQARTFTPPQADLAAILHSGKLKIILQSPGLFTQGWLPNGITQDGNSYRFDLHGVRGKLVSAAVPRAEVISGWDLALWQPKPAQRVAPTGSVYWLDEVQATAETLRKLAAQGLWSESCEDVTRRAEGFNRLWLGAW